MHDIWWLCEALAIMAPSRFTQTKWSPLKAAQTNASKNQNTPKNKNCGS
jgi:hypothetical protein